MQKQCCIHFLLWVKFRYFCRKVSAYQHCIDAYAAYLSRAILLWNKKKTNQKTSGVDTSYCCFMANIEIFKFLPGFMPIIFYIYGILTIYISVCYMISYSCKQENLSWKYSFPSKAWIPACSGCIYQLEIHGLFSSAIWDLIFWADENLWGWLGFALYLFLFHIFKGIWQAKCSLPLSFVKAIFP